MHPDFTEGLPNVDLRELLNSLKLSESLINKR